MAVDAVRRDEESGYWDWVAGEVGIGKGRISDNVYKREMIVGRLLLACPWIKQRVLEIGVGVCTAAAAINVVVLGKWKYSGTDLSPLFVDNARRTHRFDVVRTDVTTLPWSDAEFTRVMCLDSLEHVHPEDRSLGYREIARVTASGGLLLINMPVGELTFHHERYDHPFGLDDLHRIEDCGFRTRSFERYFPRDGNPGTQILPSAFVVMERK